VKGIEIDSSIIFSRRKGEDESEVDGKKLRFFLHIKEINSHSHQAREILPSRHTTRFSVDVGKQTVGSNGVGLCDGRRQEKVSRVLCVRCHSTIYHLVSGFSLRLLSNIRT
jgi:hypothetical protein